MTSCTGHSTLYTAREVVRDRQSLGMEPSRVDHFGDLTWDLTPVQAHLQTSSQPIFKRPFRQSSFK